MVIPATDTPFDDGKSSSGPSAPLTPASELSLDFDAGDKRQRSNQTQAQQAFEPVVNNLAMPKMPTRGAPQRRELSYI